MVNIGQELFTSSRLERSGRDYVNCANSSSSRPEEAGPGRKNKHNFNADRNDDRIDDEMGFK